MTEYTKVDFKPFREYFDQLPEERRKGIEAGAARIIGQMHLAEIRKALRTTQTDLSNETGMAQADISRVENDPENVRLKTLQRYVGGLGGELRLIAHFPDGVSAEIPLWHGKLVRSRVKVDTSALIL